MQDMIGLYSLITVNVTFAVLIIESSKSKLGINLNGKNINKSFNIRKKSSMTSGICLTCPSSLVKNCSKNDWHCSRPKLYAADVISSDEYSSSPKTLMTTPETHK